MTSAPFKHYFKCDHGLDQRRTRLSGDIALATQTGDEVACCCGRRWEVGFDHVVCQVISKAPVPPPATSIPSLGWYRDD